MADNKSAVTIYRRHYYGPALPLGIIRILSNLSFSVSAFLLLIRILFQTKYDYIMVSAQPFQLGLLGWFYKKVRMVLLFIIFTIFK